MVFQQVWFRRSKGAAHQLVTSYAISALLVAGKNVLSKFHDEVGHFILVLLAWSSQFAGYVFHFVIT
jgi:hypothetical protein